MMNEYDSEYFIIGKRNDDERLPSLMPDANTTSRRFRNERQPFGSSPLIFLNAWKAENLANNVRDVAADVLFDGADFMVRRAICEKLLEIETPGLFLHPATYIDDHGDWHEDYWYLTFTECLDCWDRCASEYEMEPLVAGTSPLYSVYHYSLRSSVLKEIPLESRMLFKMGGTADGMIFCHKSLAGLFRSNSCGTTLTLVAES
jgi:hypothetical protein